MPSFRERISEIPRLPPNSLELIRKIFYEEPDLPKIAALIEQDPLLTSNLFKTVNSAAFGLRVKVKSIQQAVSLVGLDALKSTIISLSLGDFFLNQGSRSSLDIHRYCGHSLATAVVMERAAQEIGINSNRQLYLLGLLHDLGRFAISLLYKDEYPKIIEYAKTKETSLARAEERAGLDSDQAWVEVARAWRFPRELLELFEGKVRGKVNLSTRRLIADSSRFAENLGYGLLPEVTHDLQSERDIFSGMGSTPVAQIGKTTDAQLKIMSGVLNLPAPDSEEVRSLLLKAVHQLSNINARFIRTQNELRHRVQILEQLSISSSSIMKNLDSESIPLSILDSIMAGFAPDAAFFLTFHEDKTFKGFRTSIKEYEKKAEEAVHLDPDQFPACLKTVLNAKVPFSLATPQELTGVKDLLGYVAVAWITPIFSKDLFTAVLGIGFSDERKAQYNGDDFSKILKILAGEAELFKENARLYNQLKLEAQIDGLTGILNRRAILKALDMEFARSRRKNSPLCVAIFDLDHFKSLNDTRGHPEGDRFLSKTGETLSTTLRSIDYVGRYGGDEFIAVLPDTELEQAKLGVERAREALLELCSTFDGEDLKRKLSVSIGVAAITEAMTRPDDLITLADTALYQAKALGKNRCVAFEQPAPALQV